MQITPIFLDSPVHFRLKVDINGSTCGFTKVNVFDQLARVYLGQMSNQELMRHLFCSIFTRVFSKSHFFQADVGYFKISPSLFFACCGMSDQMEPSGVQISFFVGLASQRSTNSHRNTRKTHFHMPLRHSRTSIERGERHTPRAKRDGENG